MPFPSLLSRSLTLAVLSLAVPVLGGLALPAMAADDEVTGALASEQASATTTQSVYDCRELDSVAAPVSAVQWFERSVWATHCYRYQARAVQIVDDQVATLSLARDVQDGVERERLHYLDGPSRSLLREGGSLRFQLNTAPGASGEREHQGGADDATAASVGRGAEGPPPDGSAPASPEALVAHLVQYYEITLDGQERIANRVSERLRLVPRDDLRYGYRLWLDRATGLPLKRMLVDGQGRALETFQLVGLTPPERYEGEVRLLAPVSSATFPWRAGWLPQGFVAQPLMAMASGEEGPRRHRLYSDGLSTISVFVEPVSTTEALRPGLHRLGASHAAVRRFETDGHALQVIAVGELPPRVLLRIAETLELAPELPSGAAESSS
ncbi:MucB/RseB C-terminal domain-containing protein [Halomonas sp. V046]|uniref:MucB/RseB C-terminal domain-containing protein n=1 Tax=Halomonas sp. V046 TaxID=3459611 RepID=UPI0040440991